MLPRSLAADGGFAWSVRQLSPPGGRHQFRRDSSQRVNDGRRGFLLWQLQLSFSPQFSGVLYPIC